MLNASSPRHFTYVLVAVAIGVAIFRIASTYSVLSQTADEAAHIGTGMEWLQYGSYTYEPLHPPLARVAVAAGPYLTGLRIGNPALDSHVLKGGAIVAANIQGNEVLNAGGRYVRNLSLARLGVLPFLVVASLVVFLWARKLHGALAAAIAITLFTTLPVVLAHAGVATTDMALTAGFGLAMYAMTLWLERADWKSSVFLGVATGVAVLAKLSALLFLPVGWAALLGCRIVAMRKSVPAASRDLDTLRTPLKSAVLAVMVAVIVVWAGYRFSFAPIAVAQPTVSTSNLPWKQVLLQKVPLPAPEFFRGIRQVRDENLKGRTAYLFGNLKLGGFWYFFPVAILVKTPVAFLLLAMAGCIALFWSPPVGEVWRWRAPASAAFVLLLACMPSRINIGLRHVLPIFVLLSILAGHGAAVLWRISRPALRTTARTALLLLLAWHLWSGARVHPDYLSYFNEFGGRRPERILVDSDLDWGQDLLRLADAVHGRHITELSVAYFGTADLTKASLPEHCEILRPHERATGWIAASQFRLKVGSRFPADWGSFAWLDAHQPMQRVGTSINLYYLPSPVASPAPVHDSAHSHCQ